jgi:hypothetical protein
MTDGLVVMTEFSCLVGSVLVELVAAPKKLPLLEQDESSSSGRTIFEESRDHRGAIVNAGAMAMPL